MKNFRFYPTLSDSLIKSSNLSIENYSFYYKTDKTYKVNVDNEENPVVLYDEKGVWDINRDNLIINSNLSIDAPSKLFGENGIAVNDAKIGIGIKWYSNESKIRGFERIGFLTNENKKLEFNIEINFERKMLRNNLILEPVLFIQEPGKIIYDYENIFANDKGIVLGQLEKKQIILEGQRSEFPVVEIKDKSRPLWEIIANFVSGDDNFNDTVYLTINSEHKDYKYINKSDKEFNSVLLEEIMINIVTFLVNKGIEDNLISFDSEESSEMGTVSYVLEHWIQIYELKEEPIMNLHRKISKRIRG